MRRLLYFLVASSLALALPACPRTTSTPVSNQGDEVEAASDAGAIDAADEPSAIASPECGTKPCVLHLVGGTYHRCLAGAAGSCFHYGALCVPDDGCMLDTASARFRQCDEPGPGRCLRFGDACKPAGACLVDPADGLYRACDAVTDGRCQSYGELCDPG